MIDLYVHVCICIHIHVCMFVLCRQPYKGKKRALINKVTVIY